MLSDYRGNSNPTPGAQASNKPILIAFDSSSTPIFDTLEVTGDVILDAYTGILVGNGVSPLTTITDSAGMLAEISDATGTGLMVFNELPVMNFNIGDLTVGDAVVNPQLISDYNPNNGTTVTGTLVETVIYSNTIQANEIGPNGILQPFMIYSKVGTLGSATFRFYLGGQLYALLTIGATILSNQIGPQLRARNSTSNQIGQPSTTTNAITLTTVDLTIANTFELTVQLANALDSVTALYTNVATQYTTNP